MNAWKLIGAVLICLLIFFMIKNQSVDFLKKVINWPCLISYQP